MSGQEILAILMLASFFVLLMVGVPVAITLGTVGFVFGVMGFGTTLFNLLPSRASTAWSRTTSGSRSSSSCSWG